MLPSQVRPRQVLPGSRKEVWSCGSPLQIRQLWRALPRPRCRQRPPTSSPPPPLARCTRPIPLARLQADAAIAVGGTPAEFVRYIAEEQKRWKPVLARAKVKPD